MTGKDVWEAYGLKAALYEIIYLYFILDLIHKLQTVNCP